MAKFNIFNIKRLERKNHMIFNYQSIKDFGYFYEEGDAISKGFFSFAKKYLALNIIFFPNPAPGAGCALYSQWLQRV